MADDDKGATSDTPLPVERPNEPLAAHEAVAPTQNEWTASDRRGPLTSAADEDAERYVPAHETDAEGGLDPASGALPGARDGEGAGVAHEPSSHEVAAPAADAPATPPAAAGRSLAPVGAGLVIGALIGAGSAWLVYSQADKGGVDPQRVAALSTRVAALEQRPDAQPQVAGLNTKVDGLGGKLAALESRVATLPAPKPGAAPASSPAPADPALAGKVAALGAALDEVRTRLTAVQARDAGANGDDAKVAALQSGLDDARKRAAGNQSGLDALKTEQADLGQKIANLTIAVAGALKKADGAQAGLDGVEGRQKTLEGKLGSPALAVVADSLVGQIVAGQPFARQVDALAALGADPAKVAILRENSAKGVPSAAVLLDGWKPLETAVVATGTKAPANANLGQRLEHGLLGLVSVRRADETAGSDLASRVNLIATDLAHDDVPGAYATWQALPADAKTRSESWGAQAKTSADALAAARDLQRTAIDALGARKS